LVCGSIWKTSRGGRKFGFFDALGFFGEIPEGFP
jgi:hypothetical protein